MHKVRLKDAVQGIDPFIVAHRILWALSPPTLATLHRRDLLNLPYSIVHLFIILTFVDMPLSNLDMSLDSMEKQYQDSKFWLII